MIAEQKFGIVLLICFSLLLAPTVDAGYGHGGHYKGSQVPSCSQSHCKVFKHIPLDPVIESTKFINSKICFYSSLQKNYSCQAPTGSAGMRALAIMVVMDMVVMVGVTTVESMASVGMLAWATMAAMELATMEAMGVVTMGAMGVHRGHMTITKYEF